jgi:hypothetical protein
VVRGRRLPDRTISGAPAPPAWGNRHAVLCSACDSHLDRTVLAFVAQRITRLPGHRMLVPADGAIEAGGRPDLVELVVRPGDWVLWPVCAVGDHPSGPRRVALPTAGLQWVDCPSCGARARLDLRALAARLPSGRALVA